MRGDLVFGRKKQRTHTQRLMDELSESYGHLRLAAGHVAGGAAERLTPRLDQARDMAGRRWSETKGTLTPLYVQMRDGAANARKEHKVKRNKWPVVIGILAAGAAVGAAGAVLARRRRAAAQWDEYDPMPSLADPGFADPKVSGAAHKVTASAATVADTVSSQAGKLADSLHGKARATAEKNQGTFAPFAEESDDPTRNSKKPH